MTWYLWLIVGVIVFMVAVSLAAVGLFAWLDDDNGDTDYWRQG
jgi:uncharacterized membrane protein